MVRLLLVFILAFAATANGANRRFYDHSEVWQTVPPKAYNCVSADKHPLHVVRIRGNRFILATRRISRLRRFVTPDNFRIIHKKILRLKKGVTACRKTNRNTDSSTPTPTPIVDTKFQIAGTIIYQDLLAPELNGQKVSGVLVEVFKLPNEVTPITQVITTNTGGYSLNLSSFGAGEYRLQFSKDFHMFTLRSGDSPVSDVFQVPGNNISPTILGMKYAIGAYGLSPVDELASSSSRSTSRLPFVRFAIPSVKVPNTIYVCDNWQNCKSTPCDANNPTHFCFDGYRTNATMVSILEKMGAPDFDVKLIIDAAFWKTFKIADGDPPCAQPSPIPSIKQKAVPMFTPSAPSETWLYNVTPACSSPVPAKDLRPYFSDLINKFQNAPVSAMTIEEENLYGTKGKPEYLEHLYYYIKEQHPKTRIFQWYSPHKYSNAVNYPPPLATPTPSVTPWVIPNIANDGWIVDQYTMLTKDEAENPEGDNIFPKYVARMLESTPSLTSIAWGSPNMNPSALGKGGPLVASCTYWNDIGWKRTYMTLAVNRNRFFNTGFDFHGVMKNSSGTNTQIGIWRAQDVNQNALFYNPALVAWFKEFQEKTIPYFLKHSYIPETLPETRPDWIPEYKSALDPDC